MPMKVDDIAKAWRDDEVPTAKVIWEDTKQVLRRSARKRSVPGVISPTNSAKKSRKSQVLSPKPPHTLLTLPYCTISRLLLHLDVDSLENLSSTCCYFDQLIAGRFLPSIDFPLPVNIIKELMNTNHIEKKPLLKLRCKKSKEAIQIFPDDDYNNNVLAISIHKLICGLDPGLTNYLVFSQMSFLSLHKVKEVDLVPDSVEQDGKFIGQKVVNSYRRFDVQLLKQISRHGSLSCVTRLDVLVDHNLFLEQFMDQLPSLLELGLTILTKTGLGLHDYFDKYLKRLEAVVAASKAPILKVTVVAETRHQVTKVFKNSFVEKLVVTGPCTFHVYPVMEKLKEVVVKLNTTLPCKYWNCKANDRELHRAGLCCVYFGAVYKHCPNVERFMGVEVGIVTQKQSYAKWNTKIKKIFYKDYLNQGGSKIKKDWEKTRWLSRQPLLSSMTARVMQWFFL